MIDSPGETKLRKRIIYRTFKNQARERERQRRGGESIILSRINGHEKEEKEIEKPCFETRRPVSFTKKFVQKLLATILPMKDPLHPFST